MSEHNGPLPFDVGPRDLISRHVDDYLAAYSGGECSELERVAIERHLDACATCRAALDATRRIRALLAPLGAQAAPPSVADSVLALLDGGATMDEPQSTACPVSLADDVPLSVARSELRHRRGQWPSMWRQREGAQERDMTTMERHTSTSTSTRTQPGQRSGGRLRSFAAVAAAVALIALGVGIFGLMSHRTTQGLGGQPSAPGRSAQNIRVDLPANSMLGGISMDSPTDGWAVGAVNNAPNGMGGTKNALLVHYDGHSWTTSPDSASFERGMLLDVSMASADDGWAVGSMETPPSMRGLLLHYTGGHWHEVDISSIGFMGGDKVHMVSANEGWIYAPVGAKMSASHKTVVFHYLNGSWRLFSSLPGWARVSMLSASDGWAVDQITHAILRYQNGAWNTEGTAPGWPGDVVMVSPAEGWIPGSIENGQGLFAMHYDGHAWSQMALPADPHAEVVQIAVAGPGDIWIFGRIDTSTRSPKTVAWHYSAGQWTRIALNFQAYPTGASMASSDSGWVTGSAGNSAALLHYDRGTWTVVYYPK